MVDEVIHEIKLCGRGGQGIVTAGEILAKAAFIEGKYAQSIPSFGAERRGSPSVCSLRISNMPILLKCGILNPEVVCMFDPTIWHFTNFFAGLKENAIIIFNTSKTPNELNTELTKGIHGYSLPIKNYELYTVDATGLALELLGRPITNTAMIGAFSKATGLLDLKSLEAIIKTEVKKDVDKNLELVQGAYAAIKKL